MGKMKRSRDSSRRKKNRKHKSKKHIRRRDGSDSSELSSTESSSCSYSSSEDDYKRRKGKSWGKAEGKVTSKRSRRRYSSSESDDDSGRLKRKRRSKRKDGYAGKKRTHTRKKRRRDVSVNSASSESYSTCPSHSDSGSSSDSEVGRKRGEFERCVKNKRSRESSRGGPSCTWDNEADDYHHVMDEFVREKSSKRLRSVITVVTASNGDEGKDETVYGHDGDHDDYPSCRINGSIEGGSKRESKSHEASVEKNTEHRDKVETVISSPRMGVDEERHKGDVEIEANQTPDPGNSSKGEDLEAILRVRALENLRRFRGGSQRNAVTSKEVSTAAEGEPLEIEPTKGGESAGCHLLEQKISVSAGKTDLESSQKVKDVVGDGMKECGSVLHDLTSPGDQRSGVTSTEKASAGVGPCTSRAKLIKPVLRQENSNPSSTSKQANETQDAQAQLTSGDAIDKSCPESSRMPAANNRSEHVKDRDANDTPKEQSSSYSETQSGRGGLDKSQDENKDASQFEQKTMSVMRGGEMVQVNYKVYIPKKTPALARRKLKR